MPESALVLFKVCSSLPEAELLKSVLEANEVPAFVASHSAYVPLDLTTGTRVMIPKQLLEKATKVLEESGIQI